ncbi:MAG: hypothetical protein Q4E73_03105 [Lachnospiraceae bacterium]|nr:hypothetical protein [Lachnospiraceae bacterium]
MPGYIMHMAEANLILNEIGKDKDEQWKRLFIAGNLLPDTKKKQEKVTSHFWAPDTLGDMAIAPDLELFLNKYRGMLHDPIVLGYYAHLYLDERFVNIYWKDMVSFYDDLGNIQKKKKDITRAEIKKNGQIVSRDQFFSGEYYYGDYSKLNRYFVDKYSIELGKNYADIAECPIDEVDERDLHQVLDELKWIMNHCDRYGEDDIKVFSKRRLCDFLENTAEDFIKLI